MSALAKNAEELEIAVSGVDEAEKRVYGHFDVVLELFLADNSRIEEARRGFTDWKAIRAEVIELMAGNHDSVLSDPTVYVDAIKRFAG